MNPKKDTISRNLRTVQEQLATWGGGEAVIDGRGTSLTAEVARDGLEDRLRHVVGNGKTWQAVEKCTFLLGDGRTLVLEVDDVRVTEPST